MPADSETTTMEEYVPNPIGDKGVLTAEQVSQCFKSPSGDHRVSYD